jgi:hypothetical protein
MTDAIRGMPEALLRLLGPTAYCAATLVRAWSSALAGELLGDGEPAPLIPIPWVGG